MGRRTYTALSCVRADGEKVEHIIVSAVGNLSRQCTFSFVLVGVHGTTPWKPPYTKAYAVIIVRVSGPPNEVAAFSKALKREASRTKSCITVGADGRFDAESAEKTYSVEILVPDNFGTPQEFLSGKARKIEDACKKP
ncbi:MAG: hypothetical protein UT41_C0002G0132 [Candidatus Wolfebacteria bacterium GW2011_GWC2_39_22]|uniref:Uncharacterized protein n=2 Tax=Candidatus Wolfeibacteriota TaxID=1752735 RepID=A0A0G1H7B3_9BACT|nr:MAG: hypothetical protein UT41_C0002G0132 [Candidatus Wolfebacteria bacterium GW2011_GWC2_39_22]KKT43266.1 MAG: hypothetical protein UW32_C0002G0127 [Candidatus Wolfebacteria bacterium GW2011_GWE2_44_13]HBI25984.1 hypothetical protein [Candidatus Wolfebacteria bacterium]